MSLNSANLSRETDDPLKAIGDMLAFNSRDWAVDKADAWLWGIVFGWADEDGSVGETMAEMAARHRWNDHDVARLLRLHANWVALELDKP